LEDKEFCKIPDCLDARKLRPTLHESQTS